jgi:uncharacterized protein YndB with AHSA1/START domain
MTERSTVHATFTIERHYLATPERVFRAFADPVAKARWFIGPEAWVKAEHDIDFRVGGAEHLRILSVDGDAHVFDATYHDIVPDRRIVYAYQMHVGETRLSVSLATIELEAVGDGSRLLFTEQAAFLDGNDNVGDRQAGTEALLDHLGDEVEGRSNGSA